MLTCQPGWGSLAQFGAHFINHTQHLGRLEAAAAAAATWTGIFEEGGHVELAHLWPMSNGFRGTPKTLRCLADYLLLFKERVMAYQMLVWGGVAGQLQAALSAAN